MATLTCNLSDSLLKQLAVKAKAMSVPKHILIENALKFYLEQLEKEEYINSFQLTSKDKEVMKIADEGLEYFKLKT
ncbi:MAG TPA: CopG family transcriptional regulator [Fulvivirga sp.]|nr:CopG family transcriptional regulator [Fulvivirga sp.]